MAVLSSLPTQATIGKLAGVIDYYLYMDRLPCARKWPHWKKRAPHPEEQANQLIFAYASKAIPKLPPNIIQAYKEMAGPTALTWKDIATRLYINATKL